MKITPIIIFSFVGVISVIIAVATTSNITEFLDTIRGVAYEGVIFSSLLAILLSLYEKNKEESKKNAILSEKQKSKDSLMKILSLLCEAYHSGGAFHWTKHVKYAETFEKNFAAFQHSKCQKRNDMVAQLKDKFFRNSCEQNLPIFTAYIPIAQKLSPAHLDAWVGITTVVSLTASEGLGPDMILDEFERFVLDFTKAKVEAV